MNKVSATEVFTVTENTGFLATVLQGKAIRPLMLFIGYDSSSQVHLINWKLLMGSQALHLQPSFSSLISLHWLTESGSMYLTVT